jgi:ABC-type Fe3+ transport system permease subunit
MTIYELRALDLRASIEILCVLVMMLPVNVHAYAFVFLILEVC